MSSTRHFILFKSFALMYGRVPKVANSSIKASLCRLLSTSVEEGSRSTADRFWRELTNGETDLITPLQARHLRGSHFSFSFVRNPFDRLVSAYNNKIIENETLTKPMLAMGLYHKMPFSEFVDRICNTPDNELDVHLLPQSSILCSGTHLVPKFIGRIEQMEDHWSALRKRMRREGLPKIGGLPQKNVRREGTSDLTLLLDTNHLVDKIAERYHQDINLFYPEVPLQKLASGEPFESRPPMQRKFSKPAGD